MARKSKVINTDAPSPDDAASVAEIMNDLAEGTQLPPDATEFDPAKLERQTGTEEKKRQYQPDPHPYQSITLGEGNDAPKMRLWRNNRKGEMAITFDEKPDPLHLQTLKDAGFRWQGEAWTKPMDPDQKWRAAADAEKAFNAICDAIREGKGLATGQSVA